MTHIKKFIQKKSTTNNQIKFNINNTTVATHLGVVKLASRRAALIGPVRIEERSGLIV